jgi:hypothetical protein
MRERVYAAYELFAIVQLMGRLCQVIVGALHELLTANIRVMSAAALASLFLEMNFIEGIIPSSLKTEKFDESIEQSYELMLRRLLELVKRKPPSSSSQLAQVSCFLVLSASRSNICGRVE